MPGDHGAGLKYAIEGQLYHQHGLERLVPAYIARLARSSNPRLGAHSEIFDLIYDPISTDAIEAIMEWRGRHAAAAATKTNIGFDPATGPDVTLHLEITGPGNLKVVWCPMLTQEQYDHLEENDRRHFHRIGSHAAFQRSPQELVFLRGFQELAWECRPDTSHPDEVELACLELAVVLELLQTIKDRMRGIAKIHWQDRIVAEKAKEGRGYDDVHIRSAREDAINDLLSASSTLSHRGSELIEAASKIESVGSLHEIDEAIRKQARESGVKTADLRETHSLMVSMEAMLDNLGLKAEDLTAKIMRDTDEARQQHLVYASERSKPVWFAPKRYGQNR